MGKIDEINPFSSNPFSTYPTEVNVCMINVIPCNKERVVNGNVTYPFKQVIDHCWITVPISFSI
jgi:hypothetical protein